LTVLHKGIHDDNMQRVAQIKMYTSNLLVAKWERRNYTDEIRKLFRLSSQNMKYTMSL